MSEYTKQLHYTKDNVTTDITLYDDSEDLEGVKLHIQDGDNEVLAALVETDADVATDLRVNYNGDIYAVGAEAPVNIKPIFEDNTPEQINAAVVAGIAQDYWDIGDKVPIELNGYVSDGLTFDHETYYAFIIDFDHNMELESEGKHNMHLQFGKTVDDVNIAFVDSGYNTQETSGMWFNMNNSITNSGGWKNSRMRTVICSAFLNAMPSNWQNVITTCTKYTDNTSGGSSNNASAVTATQDKIWLLAEYETFGTKTYVNSYEQNKQNHYNIYAANTDRIKYKHNAVTSACYWWLRSLFVSNSYYFCTVRPSGYNNNPDYHSNNADFSLGFAPAFQIGNSIPPIIYPEGISPILNNNTPAKIKEAVESGEAVNYWDIGDRIAITLNGTVGNLTFDNETYYAFILGFNHNKEFESKNANSIHLQFAKTLNDIDLTFVDSQYNKAVSATGYFSMNSTLTNTGGWESSQMNTIIGPAFYNVLPVEWQNVISDCPKYTDNVGGTSNVESNVTSSQSKIWLLSEYEVFGKRTNTNQYEQNYQSQYDYYFNGYSKVKYKHNTNTTTSIWNLRSPIVSGSTYYCAVNTDGTIYPRFANYSSGFSPGFAIITEKLTPTFSVSTTDVSLDSDNPTATVTVTYDGDGEIVAQSGNDVMIGASVEGKVITITYNYGGDWPVTVYATEGKRYKSTNEITINVTSPSNIDADLTFANNTPAQIQSVTRLGLAQDFWDIGDAIPIYLNGTFDVCTVNDTYYAFIIGFDHNKDVESAGSHNMHMQFGKTAEGLDICFRTVKMNSSNTNTNGWKRSLCRSTYCPAFLQAMPAEWQAVITECTKYTGNKGGTANAASEVTATQDKVWPLAEWEVFGARTYANSAEKNYQEQYEYYANGNSKVKYQHNSTGSTSNWWLRSPNSGNSARFCSVDISGSSTYINASSSNGFAPGFQIS